MCQILNSITQRLVEHKKKRVEKSSEQKKRGEKTIWEILTFLKNSQKTHKNN